MVRSDHAYPDSADQFLARLRTCSTSTIRGNGMKTTRIVIAGGGFAGLYAAMHFDKRLARRADVEVTLISRENFILFTPMLHEVAAGDLYPGDIVNPLRRILRHVKFIEADVQAIDLNARRSPLHRLALRTANLNSSLIICF